MEPGEGGGIQNADTATLTIIYSTLSGNAAGLGGGVFNSGTLIISNSTFSSNMASEGGGIYNSGSGMWTITNSTFSGNAASGTSSICWIDCDDPRQRPPIFAHRES